jgi:hypothetical protein
MSLCLTNGITHLRGRVTNRLRVRSEELIRLHNSMADVDILLHSAISLDSEKIFLFLSHKVSRALDISTLTIVPYSPRKYARGSKLWLLDIALLPLDFAYISYFIRFQINDEHSRRKKDKIIWPLDSIRPFIIIRT